MEVRGIKLHDMHLHIQKGSTVQQYLQKAQTLGIELMGITEHVWDMVSVPVEHTAHSAVGLAYYQDKTLERVLEMRRSYEQETVSGDGIPQLFWGCETEFAGALGKVGISGERAKLLEYVVTPHSHFFLPGFTYPADMQEPKALAGYMVDTFCQVALCPVTDIIAHPFDPTAADFQQPEMLREIFMHLPHQQLIYCFSMAAKQQKVIEINLGSFVHGVKNELYRQTYLPMFAAAKEAGCKFCLASDAQKPEDLQRICPENVEYLIDELKLTAEDFALPSRE